VEFLESRGEQKQRENRDRNHQKHVIGQDSFHKRKARGLRFSARRAVDDLDPFRMRQRGGTARPVEVAASMLAASLLRKEAHD
jgi:hypothetical protein